jgi:hypothetical protein
MPAVDIYDDAVLEEYWNWFTQDDINDLKLFARIVTPPVLLFGALLAFNYYLNKKG